MKIQLFLVFGLASFVVASRSFYTTRNCSNALSSPTNGNALCRSYSSQQARCYFSCSNGYKLSPYISSSVCSYGFSDGLHRYYKWSSGTPFCAPLKQCPEPIIENGKAFCWYTTPGYSCPVRCDKGFRLEPKNAIITCQFTEQWSKFPKCVSDEKCSKPVISKGTVTCSRFTPVGQSCSVLCNKGSSLYPGHASRITCLSNEKWSELPCCAESSGCCAPKSIKNGKLECKDGYKLGSQCQVTCNFPYKLKATYGDAIECIGEGKWTQAPTCVEHLPECSPMEEKLENGELSCHPDLSSPYCSAYCNEEYHVKPRYARYINCVGAEIWDKPVPKCVRNACEKSVVSQLKNGNIYCGYYSSSCHFQCKRHFQLIPSDANRGCDKGDILLTTPCCAKQIDCLETKRADIVIGLDSSVGFGEYRWNRVKDFVRRFIDLFSTQKDMTRFSVFRFAEQVETHTQTLFKDFDKQQFFSKFDQMEETMHESGNALQNAFRHIKNSILTKGSGDRTEVQNVVFLFTRKKSIDQLVPLTYESTPRVIVVVVDALEPIDNINPTEYWGYDVKAYWKNVANHIYLAESNEMEGLESKIRSDLNRDICLTLPCV